MALSANYYTALLMERFLESLTKPYKIVGVIREPEAFLWGGNADAQALGKR
jgi:hypothetical protein